MRRFFTSDFHLNSTLISKYASRPFKSAEENISTLVGNVNKICRKSDTLIHIGDFILSSVDRHGNFEDVPLSGPGHKTEDFLEILKPNVLLLSGNHDDGHNGETSGRTLFINLNQNYRNVSVSHYPSYVRGYEGGVGRKSRWDDFQKIPHIHLCGHVHQKWILSYNAKLDVLDVNCGVDVWNYKPVEDNEIISLLDWLFNVAKHGFFKSWSMSRKELGAYKHEVESRLQKGREQRRAERLAKKGITPEEAERRKQEALAKKHSTWSPG